MAACAIEVVTAPSPRFDKTRELVFSTKIFEEQCILRANKKKGVNIDYAREHMKAKATVIAWSRPTSCSTCSCGFALGYMKEVAELGKTVMYVDLVCSQHRLGSQLLAALEEHGRKRGATVVALRAATDELVPVYRKKGYHRIADACVPPSRAGRMALRRLDEFAGRPSKMGDFDIYTDGTREAQTIADAWRAAKLTRPKKNTRALPPGWRLEKGWHGWWMSKCLTVTNSTTTAQHTGPRSQTRSARATRASRAA